ncbi:Histidine kinase [Luteimicrobium xylanilyticum]|uniref:histidine kinase n=1 Tax=Luteimicrobium xylanilyticum TaxID=1133546 RepID=A0A5P9QE63_9MICO|nr:HAMP domain-containing sensor histidine kinase [Luteimicrobium xylanilyticum]QFU99392.1 Histidine kinase [Luteimicrobium xylanilyticum]
MKQSGKPTARVDVDETPTPPPAPPESGAGTPAPDDGPRVLHVDAPPGSPRWGWWARIPLRSRLVAIVSALLAVGLVVAAVASITLVQRYLVGKVDDELTQNVTAVVSQVSQMQRGASVGNGLLPSEYYVDVVGTDGESGSYTWGHVTDRYGTPQVPDLTPLQVKLRGGEAFTVDAQYKNGKDSGTQWRLLAMTYPTTTGDTVIVYVGLPLADVQSTVHQLGKVLGLTAFAVIIAGAALGYWLVRRELRPLHAIETTAAAIAGGDLARRIPQEPPTTEVGSLTASLNAMLAQIEESFAAQEASEGRMRRFVSDASHELRTPLATIRGYGELYRMGALTTSDQVDDTMRRIEDSASRMGTLVNDLLALARLDEGRPVRKEPVDLTALAHDATRDLEALDPTRPVALVSLAPPRPGDAGAVVPDVVVTGDEDRLRQVLANLVGNVVRHTPAGTPAQLAVGLTDDGARGVVEVRDHGPGVSAEQAQHVFERFYRADSSRNRASGGSGLGLAIVAAIVGAHDGHVAVRDTPGGGLTVRLEVPVAVAAPTAASE